MSLWDFIRGTFESKFQIGKGGPQIKNNAGKFDLRDATDAAFVNARVAAPVINDDAATKLYVDSSAVPQTRTVQGTAPITIAGDNAAHDLSANRVWALAIDQFLQVVSNNLTVAGLALKPSTTRTFASDPAITATETFIPYDTSGGSFSLQLPAANAAGLRAGATMVLADVGGSNGQNPAIIVANGADTIDGTTQRVRRSPWSAIALETDGVSKWKVIWEYVQLDWKNGVRTVTTAALAAYTVSADKQTLTGNANGPIPSASLGGVTPAVNDSILNTSGFTTNADNGIYVLQQVGVAGGGGSPFILRRRSDASATGMIDGSTRVAVQEGTFANCTLACTTTGIITIGTTGQAWGLPGTGAPGLVQTAQGGLSIVSTTPGAYPYTTLAADLKINVDSSAARSILLVDGSTELEQIVFDAGYNSSVQNITVGLANAAKSLNGAVNGTVTIAANGALRGFARDTNGNWGGGV